MSYDSVESSLEGGRPVELFTFSLGGVTYRWTSAEDVVSAGGNDFEPTEISRDPFGQGPDDRDDVFQVHVPSSNPIAQEYIVVPPAARASLVVQRLHRGDGEVVTIWQGKVQTATFSADNENATLNCLPQMRASSRLVPRDTFQGLCRNVLGDSKCAVALGDFRYTGQVTAISSDGRTITVDGLFAANGADWAKAGFLSFGTDRRMILSQNGDDVLILLPFRSSPLGQNVDVTAGCDHTPETCVAKFANLVNFRGWPFVPRINIFESGIDGTS